MDQGSGSGWLGRGEEWFSGSLVATFTKMNTVVVVGGWLGWWLVVGVVVGGGGGVVLT